MVTADYHEAFQYAQACANRTGRDHGIEAMKQYGKRVYIVRSLPRPENSYGPDARAERVRPERKAE